MSFFGSKKTETTAPSEQTITPDILSQVRIMGEKTTPPPLSPNSNQPVSLPTPPPQSTNPVSNPFLQGQPMAEAPLQTPAPMAPVNTEASLRTAPISPSPISQPASPVAPLPNNIILEKSEQQTGHSHSSKILIIGSILAVGLILIIGIFLYLEKIRDAEIVDQAPIEESTTIDSNEEVTTEPVLETETFSTTRSNYLPIDPETATKESILAEIGALEARILEAGITEPIVFQVTDQNNIPLAMSRFAYLLELGPGEDVLTALDEDFTLVIYLEGGQPRRGIATKLKEEQEDPSGLLTKLEAVLPVTFRNILYPSDLVLPTPIKFSSGSYNNSVVRYSNIAPEKGYSFDYILQNKLLFFGNSKDVTRKTLEVGVR